MRTPIFVLDAFATRRFTGNPAAVMPMDDFLAGAGVASIAAENNLAETAFLVRDGGDYRLRWFTPTTEVPLCGHATLASAAVVMERLEPGRTRVVFHTASGALTVNRTKTGYLMDFPARPIEPVSTPPGLAEALGAGPIEVVTDTFNYIALLENAQTVQELAPDLAAIARLDRVGVIVTARGDDTYDKARASSISKARWRSDDVPGILRSRSSVTSAATQSREREVPAPAHAMLSSRACLRKPPPRKRFSSSGSCIWLGSTTWRRQPQR